MDVKPKSNRLKRLEAREKLRRREERRARERARLAAESRARRMARALHDAGSLCRGAKRVLRMILKGQEVGVPPTPDLAVVVGLFTELAGLKANRANLPKPDASALRRLVLACHGRTEFFRGGEADRFAGALLALAAHSGSWIRRPEGWTPRGLDIRRQFHSLARHLVARYDVPTFMDTAWLEGPTAAGAVHQRWFIHVAQGQNIRTAAGLPVPLTKMQAHLYLRVPEDFNVLGAFRWAQVVDLGGTDRLARSVLTTRIGVDFKHDAFWVSVLRWLVAQPMLDPAHHGPIIDYLHHHRFVPAVPNPSAHRPGQPRLVPSQPNLTMKGRKPEVLLRAVAAWHRGLGRDPAARVIRWLPSGFRPFRLAEGKGEGRRVFTIAELLSSTELAEEGLAMCHCVGTYAASCASGQVSIWSLRVADASGQETRLLTLEICNDTRQITQARRKFNKMPGDKERTLLGRWSALGGPSLSACLAR